jgi:lipoprotein-anchoring transpeptidase ErfK/SrfK
MPAIHGTRLRLQGPRPAARWGVLATALALSAGLAGCTSTNADEASTPAVGGNAAEESPSPTPESAATISSNLPDRGTVSVSSTVKLTASEGTFESVDVTFGKRDRKLRGRLSADKTVWTSKQRLEPNVRYDVRSVAVDADGLETKDRQRFRTDPLTLDQQTYPSIAPLAGETVGVGMPVIVQFDVAVTDKASIERHLSVQSSPQQAGSWHWISDNEVHWRPRTYWQPGTQVTVNADINSIPAGRGVFGQLSRTASFTVGDAMVSKVDVSRHTMRVFRNGTLLRTIPISAGKPGFTTRSGTKVIIEKFREKRMDAATTGISRDDPEYYNIEDVEYAMRVTYSGEFLHAAPWSVGSQGSANVSHGCVGMSTADAAWLYNLTKRGDVVEVTGSDRYMTLTNGYGDWNASFADYKAGSALS